MYEKLEKVHGDISHDSPKLNPDPSGHLILPHCKTITMDHRQPFSIFGIKFQVGALYVLKFPTARPLLDQIISDSLETIFELSFFNHASPMSIRMKQPDSCRDYFDKLLAPILSKVHDNRHYNIVRKALALPQNTHLSQLGEALDCSQRTIERSFSRVTGFTLKLYYSMVRLEAFLDYVHKIDSSDIDWADTAFRFGFSDQPHLIRYLKSSLGVTPGKYARDCDLAIDSYGNFE